MPLGWSTERSKQPDIQTKAKILLPVRGMICTEAAAAYQTRRAELIFHQNYYTFCKIVQTFVV